MLYVGKAKNLKNRVSSYFSKQITGEKTKLLVLQIHKIRIIRVVSEIESLLLEANFIKKYKPHYNIRLINNSYQSIRITIKDQYPKVLLARQQNDPRSIYFGPYPSTRLVKMVLRLSRKIFPFQTVMNHAKRICLLNHLGLCPCPPVFESPIFKRAYKKNIQNLVLFLQGKKQQVIKNLEKERDELSRSEDFESAKGVQHQIDAIQYITGPIHGAIEYEHNPNLSEDLREKELSSLFACLQNADVAVDGLEKIECYDISNISGTNATGSMVVFTNGEKNRSLYRRFKIRFTTQPNDFGMIEEVITRRLRHTEWEFPNLIIVDGGKGQISSALKALQKQNLSIPVIGIAKREEKIVIPVSTRPGLLASKYAILRLPKDSPVLYLVMRIRDEAHRFAIQYHKKLRSKIFK